jgi:hypothetical protein
VSGWSAEVIYKRKARTIQKFHKAALGRVQRDVAQALILCRSFVTDPENGLTSGETHPLYNGNFSSKRKKVADCGKGIFEVIEESKAKREIEFSKRANVAIFGVCEAKLDTRNTRLRFLEIFPSAVQPEDIEMKGLQKS